MDRHAISLQLRIGPAPVTLLCVVLAATAAACRRDAPAASADAGLPAADSASITLRPGDPTLQTSHFRDRTESRRLLVRPPSDSAWRPLAREVVEEHPVTEGGAHALLLVQRSLTPRLPLADTLIVRRDGLAPMREWLRQGPTTWRIEFAGRAVHSVRKTGDSAAVARDDTLPEAAFAMHGLEAVIRSLPMEPGYHSVLPLYDEVGASFEVDTVDVARSESGSPGRWTVRFADSFMVTDYVIDAASREIESYEKTSRKPGGRIRMERGDAPAGDP